jgi:predicted dehydrogenase
MLKAVLVGCGAMADGWLRALKGTPELASTVKIVGLVDLDMATAQALADKFDLKVPVSTNLAAMLYSHAPDLVFDLVVPPARAEVVSQALAAGAHVLSEKPMANTLAEATTLIEAADKAGRLHAVIQNRRFLPGIRRVKALLESGALGEITAVHQDFFIGAHFGGFRDQMQHVLLLDMAIHSFDAARYLIGAAPTAVYCRETNPKGSWYAHGASADALFDFANGVTMTYRGSWCAEGANTAWECQWRIIGTKGSMIWDGNDGISAHVVAEDTGFLRALAPLPVPPAAPMVEGHAGVILDFVQAIQNQRKPLTEGRDNIHSLAMVSAAIASALAGAKLPVTLS